VVENIKEWKVDPERTNIKFHFKYLMEDLLMEVWRSCMEASAGQTDKEVYKEGLQVRKEGADKMEKKMITSFPVVILDGLDKCGSDSSQRQIFMNTVTNWTHMPKSFKFVATSRDNQILNSFCAICHHVVLETGHITSMEAMNDIHIFLEKCFATKYRGTK
jgi:hypothetical protein